MAWIVLAQVRDTWQALCKYGDEISGSVKCRELTSKGLLFSPEGFFAVDLFD